MKFITVLLLLSTLYLKSFPQLNYQELADLNTLCKKEDFEAVKTFLKINGYDIFKDNESYDHGSYFVLAEIQAHKKLGERNSAILKRAGLSDIFDEIKINFAEYDDNKELRINQRLGADNLMYISNSSKFAPLLQWLYEEWDYVRDHNLFKDSVWEKESNGKINAEAYIKYFSSEKFRGKEIFSVFFRKDELELGERKLYELFYEYHDYSKSIPKEITTSPFTVSIDVNLTTIISKGKSLLHTNKNVYTFPLIKSGSSYLIKIKFGSFFKTYILDSGASDMTIDSETYQDLQRTKQIKIGNILTNGEYTLADGSKVNYKRIKVPTFSINNIIVNNITAVLVENGKPLLLGKSFLDNFKSWKVDNKNNILVVEVF